MKLIRIPKTFYTDHWERALPTPEIIRETSRHYFVAADDPSLPELLDDALFYAHPHGPDAPWLRGLKASARATAHAIRAAGAA